MTQFVYLTGTEAVTMAGHRMEQAAQEMNHAAKQFDFTFQQYKQFMDDWLNRFEEILKEKNERDSKST